MSDDQLTPEMFKRAIKRWEEVAKRNRDENVKREESIGALREAMQAGVITAEEYMQVLAFAPIEGGQFLFHPDNPILKKLEAKP